MTVTLSPRAQVLLERYLSSGSSAEQVLERALAAAHVHGLGG